MPKGKNAAVSSSGVSFIENNKSRKKIIKNLCHFILTILDYLKLVEATLFAMRSWRRSSAACGLILNIFLLNATRMSGGPQMNQLMKQP